MNDDALALAEYLLEEHEGFSATPYRDTAGHLTIGHGINLDEGIDEDEAEFLLSKRIERADRELRTAFRWYDSLDDCRRASLIDMAYNLGLPRLLSFKKMLAALEHGDYAKAADEALDSKWARQVGYRANDIADMMRRGLQGL